MFRQSLNFLNNLPEPKNPILCNISLECTLLHARNLLDFFCGKKSSKDDLRASHFVPKSQGLSYWTSSKLSYIESRREDINKSLSHLTYTRSLQKPLWNLQKIQQEIDEAYNEFLSLLPKNERSNWTA